MRPYTDTEILTLISSPKSREEGYRILLRMYSERLYWQIRKMVVSHEDADDVLQNTMIKIFKGIAQFEQKSKLSTWMFRIAYNESVTHLNQRAVKMKVDTGELVQQLTQNLEADAYFSEDEALIEVQQAIASLPERQREIFNLRYYDALKFDDIAEILSLSTGAVKSSYHIAAKKVEQYIKNDNGLRRIM
jgi:RNA polymerase sigma factor, sigma-70 family